MKGETPARTIKTGAGVVSRPGPDRFVLVGEIERPLDSLDAKPLARLVDLWRRLCGQRSFVARSELDPTEIPDLLSRIRLLSIEAEGVFRFRLYGTHATNPDRLDMTGRTSLDYPDQAFAAMVTRHYAAVAADGRPRAWEIVGRVPEGEYAYEKVVLPMSYSGHRFDALLVMSERTRNPILLHR